MPTVSDLEQGVEDIYVRHARELGLSVWSGTLLPILGWRTYNEDREQMRNEFNEWLRQSPLFEGDTLSVSVDTAHQVLLVTSPSIQNYRFPILDTFCRPGNLHHWDLLFYRDYIRQNALRRVRN